MQTEMANNFSRRFALDILIISESYHTSVWASPLIRYFSHHPAVRSYGIATLQDISYVPRTRSPMEYIRYGNVNTVFIHSRVMSIDQLGYYFDEFIPSIRDQYPDIVFVIYSDKNQADSLLEKWPRYKSYFWLDELQMSTNAESLDAILQKCEEWHKTRFEYDFALSFAGEQRSEAEAIAKKLQERELKVFYDGYEQPKLFGRDLYSFLHEIYSARSRYCIMLISREYASRMWTIHERRAAQERALRERGNEYILPVKMDDTCLPGLSEVIGYVAITEGADKIAQLAAGKIWNDPNAPKGYIGRSLYLDDA